jgi:hypothetical protein
MLGKAEGSSKGNGDTPTDFNDCISKNELRAVLDDKFNEILQQITNLAKRIEDVEQHHGPCPKDDDDLSEEDDGDTEAEAEAQRCAENAHNRNRLDFNRHGMGGNNQGNNDPFSKTKFKIPHFSGSTDPKAYLDWEMTVDQKFSSHQVPKEYRVRLATSEFTSFALFWWNDICNNVNANANAQIPQTWTVLQR